MRRQSSQSTFQRVCHVHCKDVRPAVARMARNRGWSFLDSVLNGAFSTPGEGCVDFAAVIGILRKAGYRGWLVVEGEQDPAVAPAYRYAEMGYRLLSALVAGKSDAEARAAAGITQRGGSVMQRRIVI
jgi:inosose dehydratase